MTDEMPPVGQQQRKRRLKRADVQFLIIGAIAVTLPLCFIVIIFVINFGGVP